MTTEQIKNAFVALDVALHTSRLMNHEDGARCYEAMALTCAFGAVGITRWGPMGRVNRFAAKPLRSEDYAVSYVNKIQNDKLKRGYVDAVDAKRSMRGLKAFEYLDTVMTHDTMKKSPIEVYDFLSLIVARSHPLTQTAARADLAPSNGEIVEKRAKTNPLYGSW